MSIFAILQKAGVVGLKFVNGDIFSSKAQIITNPINCVGVMGAGLALEFKTHYPEMYKDYVKKCEKKEVKIGVPYLWNNILNFPTKHHYRNSSKLKDIELGIQYLVDNYQTLGIKSIAMPALGCGLGGLKFEKVKPIFEQYFSNLQDLEVEIYLPID